MSMPFLDHLRAESARFATVLSGAEPDAPIPTCPGWAASDLFWHLAEGQHFWAEIISERFTDLSTYAPPQRPPDDELADTFRTANDRLLTVLAETDDDVACWTWLESNQSVGFVRRRQAHEALVHRLDAEVATGRRTPVDEALATDGVLEALEWIFGGAPTWADATVDGPVGLLTTDDTGAAWTVRLGRFSGTNPDSGADHTDEPMLELVGEGTPAFEIAGTAADLAAWIWNRPSVGDVRRRGDTSGFEAIVGVGAR